MNNKINNIKYNINNSRLKAILLRYNIILTIKRK